MIAIGDMIIHVRLLRCPDQRGIPIVEVFSLQGVTDQHTHRQTIMHIGKLIGKTFDSVH